MKHGPEDLHLLIQRNAIRCSLARYPLFGGVIGAGASPSMCGHATHSSRLTNHFLVGRSRSPHAKRPTGAASKCQSVKVRRLPVHVINLGPKNGDCKLKYGPLACVHRVEPLRTRQYRDGPYITSQEVSISSDW
jgi:hypothetical protein